MPDVLIRDIPAADLARLDAQAAELGISRTEHIRRRLTQQARAGSRRVTLDDMRRFSATHADLADGAVMSEAWS